MRRSDDRKSELLSPDALKNIRVAISVSESADLHRLGFVETHFKLAIGEIARSVLVGGGKLAYGGHLDPNGYTTFLVQELQRYSRRDRPLRICLATQEHRLLPRDELQSKKDDLGLLGEIICLDSNGNPLDWDTAISLPQDGVADPTLRQQSLTAMRRYMAQHSNARILIGGRQSGFEGSIPGLIEEAILSLQYEQPLYLAGGFGGVTVDIIKALGVDDGNWLPPKDHQMPRDQHLENGLEQLSKYPKRKGWKGLNNGLTDDENRQLGATHRPTEIAALISLGLGRRFTINESQ
jgi:hypothetical protein